jgi:hypothetical protein
MKKALFGLLVFFLVLNLFPEIDNKNSRKKYLTFEKTVACREALEIRSLISGSVSEVLAAKGDRVTTGQILLRFDVSGLDEEIRAAEQSLEKWKKTLFNREHWKVRSQPAEKQAKRKVEEFKTVIKKKKQQKSRQRIHSLIEGSVLDIIDEKMPVEEDQVVARIGDDSVLKIELTPNDFNRDVLVEIQDGEIISLTFKEVNLAFSGEIKKVNDRMVILIPNDKYLLKPGMIARFQLTYDIQPEIPKMRKQPQTRPKDLQLLKEKKIGFEISAGMSWSDSGEYYDRASGIDSLMDQYIQNYGLEYTTSGKFRKNIFYFPVNALVNYRVSEKWCLKAGLEFGYGNQSNQKTYRLNWTTITEDHRYNLSSKFTYFMPFVGAERRFGKFGVYANVGLNLLSLSHQKNLEVSESTYWHRQDEDISANGNGIGILVGGKYTFLIGKKTNLILKLELCYLKVGNLSGSRDTSITNSLGESLSESIQGTIYSFEMNPYDLGWFYTWEMLDSVPGESWIRNVSEMAINMSSIRLMLGIVF